MNGMGVIDSEDAANSFEAFSSKSLFPSRSLLALEKAVQILWSNGNYWVRFTR